jgi:hypothetical protein
MRILGTTNNGPLIGISGFASLILAGIICVSAALLAQPPQPPASPDDFSDQQGENAATQPPTPVEKVAPTPLATPLLQLPSKESSDRLGKEISDSGGLYLSASVSKRIKIWKPGDRVTVSLEVENMTSKPITFKDHLPLIGWSPQLFYNRAQRVTYPVPASDIEVQIRTTQLAPDERKKLGDVSFYPPKPLANGVYVIRQTYRVTIEEKQVELTSGLVEIPVSNRQPPVIPGDSRPTPAVSTQVDELSQQIKAVQDQALATKRFHEAKEAYQPLGHRCRANAVWRGANPHHLKWLPADFQT